MTTWDQHVYTGDQKDGVDFSKYPTVASFPRSGSNFFINEFESMSGIKAKMTHGMLKQKRVISCIRNPESTLASFLTMRYESAIFSKEIKKAPEYDFLLMVLGQLAQQYLIFYNYLIESNNFIIEYDSLLDNSKKYVEAAALYWNIELLDNRTNSSTIKDSISNGYLVSSKTSDKYEYCLDMVKRADMTRLKLAYDTALSKFINL